jgi:uncharacterized membrane protein
LAQWATANDFSRFRLLGIGQQGPMSQKAAITVNRPRGEAERLWRGSNNLEGIDASVSFRDAPGDRGTEVHVVVHESPPAGKLGETVQKLRASDPLAKAKDELRRFKQQLETGVIARSDSTPEGELLERKSEQRPAQPLEPSETEKAGV